MDSGVVSILPFIKSSDGAFDDRATRVMGEAFDAACKKLYRTRQPHVDYSILAGRIIAAAQKGERDPVRLRSAELAWLEMD